MGKRKVILDPIEINKMRLEFTDWEIRIKKETSVGNINSQCGTRKQNGLRVITRKHSDKAYVKTVKVVKPKTGLNTNSWEKPVQSDFEKNYETDWQEDAIPVMSFHPEILSRIIPKPLCTSIL